MVARVRRKKIKKKASAKAHTEARAKGVADTGPVTLIEAKTLARAKAPELAVRAARKDAVPPASPAAVGAERQRLENERRDEFAKRVREYKDTMAVMKRRGARRPRPKGAARRMAGAAEPESASFAPLQIFAEGDSWFDYRILCLAAASSRASKIGSASRS